MYNPHMNGTYTSIDKSFASLSTETLLSPQVCDCNSLASLARRPAWNEMLSLILYLDDISTHLQQAVGNAEKNARKPEPI